MNGFIQYQKLEGKFRIERITDDKSIEGDGISKDHQATLRRRRQTHLTDLACRNSPGRGADATLIPFVTFACRAGEPLPAP